MPINAPVEYYKAEEKYKFAKTREEKIACLEEMIRLLPKHHGSERLLKDLRKRLAKLKSQKPVKKSRTQKLTIKKEGAGQVCLLGLTNSGKSTLLKELTNVDVDIADYPYTTVKPEVGMMKYEDVRIQIVEIPSTFDPEAMSVVHGTDLIIFVLDGEKDTNQQKRELDKILEKRRITTRRLQVVSKKPMNIEKIKTNIWNSLGIIRIYTKTPGKKPEKKPIIFPKGSTVEDVVKEVHKSFLEHFRFAIVKGRSVRFGKEKVGLEHVLKDKDVVEVRT